jgi:hypothetical protein
LLTKAIKRDTRVLNIFRGRYSDITRKNPIVKNVADILLSVDFPKSLKRKV